MWAVIDIGSNTIRLVFYLVEGGRLHPVLDKKYAAGLAGYIEDSRMSRDGIQVLIDCLADIRLLLGYIKPQAVFPFATASLRACSNGRDILKMVRERCGFDVRLLSGEEEAAFDYDGAQAGGLGEEGLLVDVGGGSTELAFFKDGKMQAAACLPVGSLNLYKNFVQELFPTPQEAKAIRDEVKQRLQRAAIGGEQRTARTLFCVGGTARATQKLLGKQYGLAGPEPYTYRELKETLERAEEDPRDMLRRILRSSPDRVHTLLPGMTVFKTVARFFRGETLVTCRNGVREGYLLHCLSERGGFANEKMDFAGL